MLPEETVVQAVAAVVMVQLLAVLATHHLLLQAKEIMAVLAHLTLTVKLAAVVELALLAVMVLLEALLAVVEQD
jgi:hypothetical protein